TPDCDKQLKAFLARYEIGAIVVSEAAKGPWPALFATLKVEPLHVGGVALYNVPSQIQETYFNADLRELERNANGAWFADLLRAADTYVSRGFDVSELTPARAADLGLLPPAIWTESLEAMLIRRRIGGPMLWIGPWSGGTVAVAL